MGFSDFGHYLLEQDNVRILCGYMESIRNGPGFVIPSMSDDLRQKLASMLPKFGSLNNPLDMTGGTSLNGKLMADCLREMLTHDAFDAVLLCVNLIWREGKVLMQELAQLAATASKPFAVSWWHRISRSLHPCRARPSAPKDDPRVEAVRCCATLRS